MSCEKGSQLTIRHARLSEYGAMMRFINGVFFDGRPVFQRQWCHIYEPPHRAYRWGHLAFENGEIVGHIGIYPMRLRVDGGVLKVGGIGAVSTAPRHRGRGIMSRLLEYAIATMHRAGYDISILWGDRWRYANYGWELCGNRLEWIFHAARVSKRHGDTSRAIRAYDPKRDLGKILALWNRDSPGSCQSRERLRLVLHPDKSKTIVTDEDGFGFATYTCDANHTQARVDKAVGTPAVLRALFLWIWREETGSKGVVKIVCPSADHPLRNLAVTDARECIIAPQGQVKILNLASTLHKLLPALNQRYIPGGAQPITLKMAGTSQSATLRFTDRISLAQTSSRNVVELPETGFVRLIFGGPLATQLDCASSHLTALFPVNWHVEPIVHV